MISKFIWRTYYKAKLGDQYEATLARATSLGRTTAESTKGGLHTFFDMKGNRIRGFDNGAVKVRHANKHPLIVKYGQ